MTIWILWSCSSFDKDERSRIKEVYSSLQKARNAVLAMITAQWKEVGENEWEDFPRCETLWLSEHRVL